MYELYEAAFSGVNLVYTTFLILVLVYWLIVILGIVDLDTVDWSADVDVGGIDAGGVDAGGVDAGGVDAGGVDAGGVETGGAGTGGSLTGGATGAAGGFSWLAYFNVGEAPIIFYASIVVLVMWIVSIQINHWIDLHGPSWANEHQGWIAAALAFPNFLFAMFVAKYMMVPIKRLRRETPQTSRLIGKVANVTSLEVSDQIGRVELPKHEGSLILNARTRGGEVLHKGDAAEILERVPYGNGEYFVVTKKHWT